MYVDVKLSKSAFLKAIKVDSKEYSRPNRCRANENLTYFREAQSITVLIIA
jgi:hypothetical protein